MKRFIELNNQIFEMKEVKGNLYPNKQRRTLSECYVKPSIVKQAIYDSWLDWVQQVNMNTDYILKHFTIESYNCMLFSLSIDVYIPSDELIGKIYITKTRQEFWSIV